MNLLYVFACTRLAQEQARQYSSTDGGMTQDFCGKRVIFLYGRSLIGYYAPLESSTPISMLVTNTEIYLVIKKQTKNLQIKGGVAGSGPGRS